MTTLEIIAIAITDPPNVLLAFLLLLLISSLGSLISFLVMSLIVPSSLLGPQGPPGPPGPTGEPGTINAARILAELDQSSDETPPPQP